MSDNADIFTPRDEIYLVCTPKKVVVKRLLFFLFCILQAAKCGRFSSDSTSSVCLLGVHLENCLE